MQVMQLALGWRDQTPITSSSQERRLYSEQSVAPDALPCGRDGLSQPVWAIERCG